MTEMMKIWLSSMYLQEAEDHLETARFEHLCALGSDDQEIAIIHEHSADEHREFARILKEMAEQLSA